MTTTWRGGRRGYGNQLSPREIEVARYVARGMTDKEIAEVMFISPRTVEGHIQKAMQKLGTSSRTAVAVAVLKADLTRGDF